MSTIQKLELGIPLRSLVLTGVIILNHFFLGSDVGWGQRLYPFWCHYGGGNLWGTQLLDL